jgi:hypothetical protein
MDVDALQRAYADAETRRVEGEFGWTLAATHRAPATPPMPRARRAIWP